MEKGKFECRICMEKSNNPTATQCGHLFCLECIERWLRQNHAKLVCPVCKAGISEERLIRINPNAQGVRIEEEKVGETRGRLWRLLDGFRVTFSPDPRDSPDGNFLSSVIKAIFVVILGIMLYRMVFDRNDVMKRGRRE